MKLRFFTFALGAFICATTAEAQTWRHVATTPTVADLDSVYMLSPQEIFISGRQGTPHRLTSGS